MTDRASRTRTEQARKLGNLVYRARSAKGISIRAIGKELGINYSTISYIESGQIERPSVDILQGLSRVLDIPLEDLYSLAGYMRSEGLPEFPVYLRSKYGLNKEQTEQLERYFRRVTGRGKGGKDAKPSS